MLEPVELPVSHDCMYRHIRVSAPMSSKDIAPTVVAFLVVSAFWATVVYFALTAI